MDTRFSAAHLCAIDNSFEQHIRLAAEAGFDYVSLRTIPMGLAAENTQNNIAHDPELLRKTKELLIRLKRIKFKNMSHNREKEASSSSKTRACLLRIKGIGGFGAKIFVIRPEGVQMYVERAKTEIENDLDLKEKFVEFQPYKVNS